MKILLDPVYTGEVNRCASAVKFKTCVEYLLETEADIFFYWLVPKNMKVHEWSWLPDNPRVNYIPIDYFEDRHKEYWNACEEYRKIVNFTGPYWDTDIVITNRTSMVPYIKWSLHRPNGVMGWSKLIFLLEDMACMSFKMSVPQSTPRTGDLATLWGYLTASVTCVSSFWQKKPILDIARSYLSMASVRYLSDNLHEATHTSHGQPRLKDVQSIARVASGEKRFTISHAGRMLNGANLDDVFGMMTNQWIKDGNIRLIVCTVSKNTGRVQHSSLDDGLIEVMRPEREEFWRIMREDADVGLFMSPQEDYPMSMMEPLMHGTPIIILRAEYSIASVGPDYPFFVKDALAGFALLNEFRANYEAMYAKFADWSRTKFTALLTERDKTYVPVHLSRLIAIWRKNLANSSSSLENNDIVQMIAIEATTFGGFYLVDVIRRIENAGGLRFPLAWKDDALGGQGDRLRLTFSTEFDGFRAGLLKLGFKDAGPKCGYMERSS